MNLAQLPAECRTFIAAEAKERGMTEQAVLDYYCKLIDETDAEVEAIAQAHGVSQHAVIGFAINVWRKVDAHRKQIGGAQ